MRINASNAKNGFDLDYEDGNVQAFINEFKNRKIKNLEKQLIKEKTNERESRKRNKREIRKRTKRQK